MLACIYILTFWGNLQITYDDHILLHIWYLGQPSNYLWWPYLVTYLVFGATFKLPMMTISCYISGIWGNLQITYDDHILLHIWYLGQPSNYLWWPYLVTYLVFGATFKLPMMTISCYISGIWSNLQITYDDHILLHIWYLGQPSNYLWWPYLVTYLVFEVVTCNVHRTVQKIFHFRQFVFIYIMTTSSIVFTLNT